MLVAGVAPGLDRTYVDAEERSRDLRATRRRRYAGYIYTYRGIAYS